MHNDVNGLAWIKMVIDDTGIKRNVQLVKMKPDTMELQAGPSIMNHLHLIGGFDLAAKIQEANGLGAGAAKGAAEEMV